MVITCSAMVCNVPANWPFHHRGLALVVTFATFAQATHTSALREAIPCPADCLHCFSFLASCPWCLDVTLPIANLINDPVLTLLQLDYSIAQSVMLITHIVDTFVQRTHTVFDKIAADLPHLLKLFNDWWLAHNLALELSLSSTPIRASCTADHPFHVDFQKFKIFTC